jgi:transposase
MTTTTASPSLLLDQISALRSENELLRNELNCLKEQVDWFRRQLFGQRSEKIKADLGGVQPLLTGFDFPAEAKAEEKQTIPAHERKKVRRQGQDKITLPPDLPVERQVLDLPEAEKVCSISGKPLVKIGEEITRKLAHKPGSYYIKEIIRPKYALPASSEGAVLTAPLPDCLLPRCQADESLLADIVTKKFADHLPLYRISEIFSREGIEISRQTLCEWVLRVGKALDPLYNEMMRKILDSGNVFVDETPVSMLDPGKGKVHQAYMWVMVGGKEAEPTYRIYTFRTDRKHENAENLLQSYSGVLHSDKYGAYEKLANQKQFIWCPCWAHIRRKFFEAESGDPPFRRWVLRKIRYLFMLEKVAWARSEDERLRIRQEKEVIIIDELIHAIKKRLIDGKLLPKSKFREALGYFLWSNFPPKKLHTTCLCAAGQ